mgnify:FL=1
MERSNVDATDSGVQRTIWPDEAPALKRERLVGIELIVTELVSWDKNG